MREIQKNCMDTVCTFILFTKELRIQNKDSSFEYIRFDEIIGVSVIMEN